MGPDLFTRWEIKESELEAIARRVRGGLYWLDVNDIRQEVAARLLARDQKDPNHFQNRNHVLHRARIEAGSIVSDLVEKAKASRVSYRDPTQLPEPAQRSDDVDTDRVKRLLANRDALMELLADVAPEVRAVFPLMWEGATQEQVAETLGLNRWKVGRLWRAALEYLKDVIEKQG